MVWWAWGLGLSGQGAYDSAGCRSSMNGEGGREFENTSRAGSPSSSPRPDQANADGLSVRRRTGIEREKCACAALRVRTAAGHLQRLELATHHTQVSHLPTLALCFMISRHRWQGMAVRASGTWGVIVDVGPGLETLQLCVAAQMTILAP